MAGDRETSRSRLRSRSRSGDSSRNRSRLSSRGRRRFPSSRNNPTLYALVKWLTGQHKGSFSHNVCTSWIRDFDPRGQFDSNGYAIEWRVGNKPRNGWHLYDGLVLGVSYDLEFLKRKEGEQVQDNGPPSTPRSHLQKHVAPPQNSPNQAPHNDLLRALIGALQLPNPSSTGSVNGSPGTGGTQALTDPDQVKIGKVLSVPKSCYMQAKASRSPSAMTMYLTRAAFSRRRLLRSSYAGQKRKRSDGLEIKKPSLKRFQAMRDIQDFVLARFSITQSAFGAAVNACTGEKAKSRPEIEYEENMSASEEEEETDD